MFEDSMSKQQPLLFQVGQLAESRSFDHGYRSAWFRCEIKEVARSKGQIKYRVRYYDYDADGLEWLDLYQLPEISKGSKKAKREMMLRPQFPPIYHEHELPIMNAISDVAVVVDGGWSIGDIVDWWEEGCYWIGTITKILGDSSVEIKLPDAPIGEGLSYVASYKDLRPSLNWSPDSGWTFPVPTRQSGHSHARMIQFVNQAPISNYLIDVVEGDNQNPKATPRSLLDSNHSISSHTSASSLPLLSTMIPSRGSPKQGEDIPVKEGEKPHEESMKLETGTSTIRKPRWSDSVSSRFIENASNEVPVASSAKITDPENMSAKRMSVKEPIRLNSTTCDDIEAAILDLEEILCKVKWLKQILKYGSPSSSLDNNWDFLENPSVSEPR